MLGEKYTLDIRPTFIDELDRAATYKAQGICPRIRLTTQQILIWLSSCLMV